MKYFYSFIALLFPIFSFSQSKISLNCTFSPPESYRISTHTFSQSSQEVSGNKQNVDAEYITKYNFNIIDKKDSGYTAELKFKTISYKVKQQGQTLYFHSDSTNNSVSEKYRSFLSKKLAFFVSRKGKITALYTLDTLFPDSSDIKTKQLFSQAVNQKLSEILPLQIHFPEKPVKLNESWTSNDTDTSDIFLLYDKQYTLDSLNNSAYFISEKAKIKSDKNNFISMNRVYITYDVTGESFSVFKIDKKTGIITKGLTKQKMSGKVEMHYTKNGDPAFTWLINLTNRIKLNSEKTRKP